MSNLNPKAFLIVLSVIISLLSLTPVQAEQFKSTGTIDAYFSLDGGCTEAIVKELYSCRNQRSS
jgi:hypothetical protein